MSTHNHHDAADSSIVSSGGSRHPIDGRSATDGGRPTTSVGRSTTGDDRPATGGDRPTTGGDRPTTGDGRSATGDGRPATGDEPESGRGRTSRRGDRRSTAPTYPSAEPVGQHLVVDRSEWIPGANPESHLRHDGQRAYRESYYRCVKCGEERQAKRDFPEACDGDFAADSS